MMRSIGAWVFLALVLTAPVVMAQEPTAAATAPAVQWPVPVTQDPAIADAAERVAGAAQSSALNLQIIGLLTLIFNGVFVGFGLWMAYKQKVLESGMAEAKESARKLAAGQQEAKVVADSTHTLVNTAMGIQLRLVATALRRLAAVSGKQEDIDEAAEAGRLYDEHMRKQGLVDDRAAATVEEAAAEAAKAETAKR